MNSFDGIAPYYDRLATFVFGKAIRSSQTVYFNIIKPNDSVLICGGGTGWILSELDNLNIPLRIEYVEYSKKMIEKSKKRAPFKNLEVVFMNEDVLKYPFHKYDIIITPFLLDVFSVENLKKVTKKLKSALQDSGSWLVTDFRNTPHIRDKILIRMMHFFFRIFCSLESSQLQNFESILVKENLRLVDRKLFYHEFIGSYQFKLR